MNNISEFYNMIGGYTIKNSNKYYDIICKKISYYDVLSFPPFNSSGVLLSDFNFIDAGDFGKDISVHYTRSIISISVKEHIDKLLEIFK